MWFQVAFPKRISLETSEEGYETAIRLIKKHNGSTPIFRSIYNYVDYPSADTVIIDKLFFDFDHIKDNPKLAYDDMKVFHNFLMDKDIKHSVLFSGNGFHVFVYTNKIHPGILKNVVNTVRNAFDYFASKVSISPDENVKDVMRVARVPGTINIKTGLHCIFLNKDTIQLSREEIKELAQSPKRIDKYIFGSKEFEIREFDVERTIEYAEYKIDEQDIDDDIVLSQLPKCLASSLLNGDCGYHERFAIITAMRDLLIPIEVAKRSLKEHLTPEKYRHCVIEENQLNYLYQRKDLLCPSCITLKGNGLCVEGCLGYNIYL